MTIDTLLEIFILDRYKYLTHHAIAFVIFITMGYAENLQEFYSPEQILEYLVILFLFEVSTMLLNIRSLSKQFLFTKNMHPTDNISKEAYTELFFILTYGGIRLIIAPYMLLSRGSLRDPIVWLGFFLVYLSYTWVSEWVENTKFRYGDSRYRARISIWTNLND